MNTQKQIQCIKCQRSYGSNKISLTNCGHTYCGSCLDQISLEGGSNCYEPTCTQFLNISDLMNRQYNKFAQANNQLMGNKMQETPKQTQQKQIQKPQNQGVKIGGTKTLQQTRQQQSNQAQTFTPQKHTSKPVQQFSPANKNLKQNTQTLKNTPSKPLIPKQAPVQEIKQTAIKQNTPPKQQEQLMPQPPNLKQHQQQQCDNCKNQQSDIFISDICHHWICRKCLSISQTNQICVVKGCGWQLNQDLLKDFIKPTQQFKQDIPEMPKLGHTESNIYENGEAEHILTSQTFKEIVLADMSVLNINQFVCMFDELKVKGSNFRDLKFPPNHQSLGNVQYQWQRVGEIYHGDYQFFSKDFGGNRFGLGKYINSTDIIQGTLGNCYLLASISALGNRRPDLLLENFITRAINEQGIYCVRLCLDGVWQAVYVDDYFPVYNNQPAFTKGRNNAIWVMVLEKAWAKLLGSYSASAAGSMQEVLRVLTGAPTEIAWTAQPDFIKQLERFIEQKSIMVAATQSADVQAPSQGLVANHAYTVLKIRVIQHPKQGVVQLIKLRNPWGRAEWNGDWSYNSQLWTAELRKNMKLDDDDNGVFYMDIGSFIQHFRDMHVCHVRENNKYTGIQIKSHKQHAVYHKVEIITGGTYYFSICQKNQRFPQTPNYSFCNLLIARKFGTDYDYVHGRLNKINEMWCECNLEPGEYIIYSKVKWEHNTQYLFGLSSYGPAKVEFVQIPKIKQFLQTIFSRKAMEHQPKKDFNTMQQPNVKWCYEFDRLNGFGFYFIDNQGAKTMNCKLNFSKFDGLKLCKPFKGSSITLSLSPHQQFLAIIKVLQQGYIFEVSQKVSFV